MPLSSSRSMTPRIRRACARSSIRRQSCMCAVSCIPRMCTRLRLSVVAEELARDLATCGIMVVSGMAGGIDAAAHRGALAAGGRTIAVLGCGPDVMYPPEHRGLMSEIIGQGAVMAEFAAGARAPPGQVARRIRILGERAVGGVV